MDKVLPQKKAFAIIGCGISSLSFLFALPSQTPLSLKLFEKNPNISNRASSKKHGLNTFDNGANYLCTEDPEILDIITNKLGIDELIEIEKWVFPFSKEKVIDFDKEKAKKHNILKKFNYLSGIQKLSNLLMENVKIKDLQINFNTKITRIKEIADGKYQIFSKNECLGDFDEIIFGLPTPNALKILQNSEFLFEMPKIDKILLENQYKTIFSLAIAFGEYIDLDFYALINFDREHAISWLSVENHKKGHIMEKNTTFLLIQASDQFSRDLIQKKIDQKNVISSIKQEFFEILPIFKEKKVIFEDLTKWKYALPNKKLDFEFNEFLAGKNLHIIGDGLIGKGRIDGSMRTGLDLYQRIKAKL